MSPFLGGLKIRNLMSVKGIFIPYTNLLTNMWSPTKRVGIMDPEGILNACTTKALIKRARSTAMNIASVYSLNLDL